MKSLCSCICSNFWKYEKLIEIKLLGFSFCLEGRNCSEWNDSLCGCNAFSQIIVAAKNTEIAPLHSFCLPIPFRQYSGNVDIDTQHTDWLLFGSEAAFQWGQHREGTAHLKIHAERWISARPKSFCWSGKAAKLICSDADSSNWIVEGHEKNARFT